MSVRYNTYYTSEGCELEDILDMIQKRNSEDVISVMFRGYDEDGIDQYTVVTRMASTVSRNPENYGIRLLRKWTS